jgi:hypothetical protein
MNRLLLTQGIALLGLSACATIHVTASWQRPGAEGRAFKRIAVVALSGPTEVRRTVENHVLWELAELGIAGVAGNDVFADAPKADQKDAARKRLEALGVDGAITIHMVARNLKEKLVSAASADDRYTQDFYSSYYTGFDPVYRGTTVDVDVSTIVECILYRLHEPGAVAIREITLKKRDGTINEVSDATQVLVDSLDEAHLLRGAK